MARRSKPKKQHNVALYIAASVILIAALVAGKFALDKRSEHFVNVTELSVKDYTENANSLSGNTCRVTGKITEKLKWTPDNGQLLALAVEQGEKGRGTIPIKVPANIDQVNLERGHTYTFKVDINREGLPVALDVKAK